MGKDKPPIQMVSKRLSPDQILNQANGLKDRFSGTKGKTDQMIGDALTASMQGMLNMIQSLLGERAQDEAKIAELQKQISEKKPKVVATPPK